MSDKVETGLSIRGNAEFGKKLVEAAIEDHKDKTQKAIVGFVQEIMSHLEKQREQVENAKEQVALLEAKLKAVEEGKFDLARTGKVTFHDPELQKKAAVGQPTCPNCGFGNPTVRL
jgi:2,4-dienoyl-CoA reductase-like NADH-dependent reductase (Old Yellow Enzyme family)